MHISSSALLQTAFAGPAASPAGDSMVSGTPSSRKHFYLDVFMIVGVLFASFLCFLGLTWVLRCSGRPELPETRRRVIPKLPVVGVYSAGLNLGDSCSECAICLVKFEPGEQVRFLPKCEHRFHVGCVNRWLIIRPSCPTCREGVADFLC